MTYKNGDRVKRDGKTGTVIQCYSRPIKHYGDFALGPYPELFDVKWDNGEIETGFLPHGLVKI